MGNLHMSSSVGVIFAAIAKAQCAMDAASKDAENPHFRSRYADLAAVWDVLRPTLSKEGVATIQAPAIRDKAVVVTTVLGHGSGEWMWADLPMPLAQWSAHAIGSAITYGRRYALSAMCGVAPDDDDDGNGASAVGSGPPARQPAPASKPSPKATDAGQSRPAADTLARVLKAVEAALLAQSLPQLTKLGPTIGAMEKGPERSEAEEAYLRAKGVLAQAQARSAS